MQPGKRAGQLDLMEKRVPTRTIGRGFENASGLGFWTSHPLHHAHMVNRQSHVRPEPCEARARRARARRARAKNCTRKAGNHAAKCHAGWATLPPPSPYTDRSRRSLALANPPPLRVPREVALADWTPRCRGRCTKRGTSTSATHRAAELRCSRTATRKQEGRGTSERHSGA